jgi:AsmA protein
MRALKWAAAGLGGAVLLAGGGVYALVAAVDGGTLTPRILAAIEGATGRAATLGAVSLRPGLVPRIAAEGATLANLPGGSQPEMARIRRLEVRLALLPLLRGDVDIRAITIDGADILLERTADGAPNWVFRAAPRPEAPAAEPGSARAPAPRRAVAIAEISLTDSRITLPDPRLGTLAVAQARVNGFGGGGPVAIAGDVALHGVAGRIEAETGALPLHADAAWPYRATLAVAANRITVQGVLGAPVALNAAVPDPAALRPLVEALAPGAALPPALPPLEAAGRLGPGMVPSDLSVTIGALDVGPYLPGLALTRLVAHAPAQDGPVDITIETTRAGVAARSELRVEPLAALLPWQPAQPARVTLDIAAAGATLHATGTLAQPRSLSGAAFDLRIAVPALAALAPMLPAPPPPLTDLAIEARLEAAGGLTGALGIPSFRIQSPELQATGALTLAHGSPVGIDGRIAAGRIDVDALAQRLAAAPAPAEHRPGQPAPAPAPAGPRPAPAVQGRVIPDLPLPVAAARAYRGAVAFTVDHLIVGGTDWRQVRGSLAMDGGTARLRSFAAVTPGGPVRGEATLDAAADPPRLALALRSEGRGLDLAALRRARGEATGIEGHAELALDIHGRGATTRAVAATLTGELGLAIIEGRLAHGGMLRLGPDLLALLLPGAPQDGVALRCVALRMSAEDGMARSQALLAETSAGRIEGVLAMNLRTEALAARLLPDVTLLGIRVRAPVGIGGTLAAPRVGVEPGRALGQVIEDTVANRLWRDPTVEWLRGRVQGGSPAGDCAAQLRLARMGADGPVPAAERIIPGVPRELQGTTQDVLRGLGGIGGALGGAVGGLLGGGRR